MSLHTCASLAGMAVTGLHGGLALTEQLQALLNPPYVVPSLLGSHQPAVYLSMVLSFRLCPSFGWLLLLLLPLSVFPGLLQTHPTKDLLLQQRS